MTDYTVTINMDADTISALSQSNFYLYGFKAVSSSDKAGRPLTWFKMGSEKKILSKTYVEWSDNYQAYISNDKIVENTQIRVGNPVDIKTGQTWELDKGVTNMGPSNDISILNETGDQLTCGISEKLDDQAEFQPYCAFPLYSQNLQIITPIEKILMMFSTENVAPGTVVTYLYDLKATGANAGTYHAKVIETAVESNNLASILSGILIDLTGSTQREVTYSINEGWNWGEGVWAEDVAVTANLVPLLILGP